MNKNGQLRHGRGGKKLLNLASQVKNLVHNATSHESPGQPDQPGLDFPFLTRARVKNTEPSIRDGNLTWVDSQLWFGNRSRAFYVHPRVVKE